MRIRNLYAKLLRPGRMNRRSAMTTVENLEARVLLYNPRGVTWGEGAALQFSYMNDGVRDSNSLDSGWTNTSLATLESRNQMPASYETEIDRALQLWSRVANISFEKTADGGEAFGDAGPADIRIGAHNIDGPGEALASTFYPPGLPTENLEDTTVWGDTHFDTSDSFQVEIGPGNLFNHAVHEFGHAIGLEDTATIPSIMNRVDDGSRYQGVQLDDVRGAQLIYGPAIITNLHISVEDDPAPFARIEGGANTFLLTKRTDVLLNPDFEPGNVPSLRLVDVIDVVINGRFAFSVDSAGVESITVQGSDNADILDASGIDVPILFIGEGGHDSAIGGSADDTLIGGAHKDTLRGGEGDDSLIGNSGKDQLHGDDGRDLIRGGRGPDTLFGGQSTDTVYGGSSNDEIGGGQQADYVHGGHGQDTLRGGDGDDTVLGGTGSDFIEGGLGDDILRGHDGNDTLLGQAGNDQLGGSLGHDSLFGDSGDDTVLAGAGDDIVHGGSGQDRLYGHGGLDHLSGGEGVDTINAGSGADTLIAGDHSDLSSTDGFDGDSLHGGGGGDEALGLFESLDSLFAIEFDNRLR